MSKKGPVYAKLRHHVFICTNEREAGHPRGCCKEKGSDDLLKEFKEAVKKHGLSGAVRAQRAGCLDTCEEGPSVVVYPDNVWYGRVRPRDVEEIVESHLVHGKPVERLRTPGK